MTQVTTRTDRGWTLTAGALAAVAMSAIAVTAGGPIAQRAAAAAPAVPNGCSGAVTSANSSGAAQSLAPTANPDEVPPNPATQLTYKEGPVRISTITVSTPQTYLRDVDLRTFITHEASRDVFITLTGPGPNPRTIVINSGSLSKSERDTFNPGTLPGPEDDTGYVRNGGPNNDEWNGTRWDDQGGFAVNDFAFPGIDDGGVTPLIEPEGSLGGFIGINPNGVWTLKVQNLKPFYATSFTPPPTVPPTVPPPNPTEAPDVGSFVSWGLDLSTLAAAPGTTPSSFSAIGTPVALPDVNLAGITRDITVSGVAPGQTIQDIDLLTRTPHSYSSDLEITLKSPLGTEVTIATDPGRDEDPNYSNVLSNTRWDDSALEGVTDAIFASGTNKTTLQPEEALAAFNGENPNGVWKLKVVDDGPLDAGSLEGASIELKTTAGCGKDACAVQGAPQRGYYATRFHLLYFHQLRVEWNWIGCIRYVRCV